MFTRAVSPAGAAAVAMLCLLLGMALLSCACGGGHNQDEKATQAVEVAIAFLDACGDLEAETVRSFLSRNYLESNQVPESLTEDDIIAALGRIDSYRIAPDTDISIEGERAVVTVNMRIVGMEEKEETLILSRQDGEWKVEGFTAMDWTSGQTSQSKERVEVEEATRDFVVACIDQDTEYIHSHLSEDYREKHRLEEPWTSAEFSGVFGTARSYDFDPKQITIEDGTASLDVTIEFGSRGNLESETGEVCLVEKGGEWLIDAFPFFIY
jgi:hypothetical protein